MHTAVVIPGPKALLFGSGSLDRQTTLHLLDDSLHAVLPLLLPNYLSNGHELREQTPYDDH